LNELVRERVIRRKPLSNSGDRAYFDAWPAMGYVLTTLGGLFCMLMCFGVAATSESWLLYCGSLAVLFYMAYLQFHLFWEAWRALMSDSCKVKIVSTSPPYSEIVDAARKGSIKNMKILVTAVPQRASRGERPQIQFVWRLPYNYVPSVWEGQVVKFLFRRRQRGNQTVNWVEFALANQ